jgi:threonine synthase
MKKILFLKCISCGKEHSINEVKYVCNSCGGNLEVIYDYNLIKKRFTHDELKANTHYDMWRYWDLLPVEDLKGISSLKVGFTPLYKSERLRNEFDVEMVYIKDDTQNPSASFKDRATNVVLKRAIETLDEDARIVATASTGNAASSLACIASSLGINSIIFVPSTSPKAKIAQLVAYGAKVVSVRGSYDDAFELCIKACESFGWYNGSAGYNPYTREGKKTAAFEICEQLEWEVPDKVFVPVGDGNIISGIWKGFLEFKKIGFIDKLPKLVAVQSEESNAIYKAFTENLEKIPTVSGKTICDSISVKTPRDGFSALLAIKESGGFAINVSDKEVKVSIKEFASKTGIFAEPSASSVYAAFKKAREQKLVEKNDTVLLLITGSGLKDITVIEDYVKKEIRVIDPTLDDLKNILPSILKK